MKYALIFLLAIYPLCWLLAGSIIGAAFIRKYIFG